MTRSVALAALVWFLGLGCDDPLNDEACSNGEAECLSLYEIRYCTDGSWGEGNECPLVTNGEFEVTTICDDGLCRP